MRAYYNEHDPKAAAWLRELIARGLIADGDVDETDIRDVDPDRLGRYTQCHFFAGIGGWSLALRLAGWPDDRPVWTGSCPCQPFSAAGRRAGLADERHLWPHWHHLISQCRPAIVFGEQVASKDGLGWLDLVCADMEATGYAIGAADICAAGIGAPHIRQRLWFVGERLADANGQYLRRGSGKGDGPQGAAEGEAWQRERGGDDHRAGRSDGGLADADGDGRDESLQQVSGRLAERAWSRGVDHGVGDTHDTGSQEHGGLGDIHLRQPDGSGERRQHLDTSVDVQTSRQPRPTNGQWRDADWLFCRDGKWRPVEPASQRMANGLFLCLGSMRRTCVDEEEEALNAEEAVRFGRKALRVLREFNGPEAFWLSVGGRIGFPQATVLLAIMRKYARELGVFLNSEATGGEQDVQAFLQALRECASQTPCPPQGSESSEQLIGELGDALSKLSQDSAQYRELVISLASYTAGPLAQGTNNRVGRLRGYGNAIVPQVAAEFIRSVM